MSFSFRFAIVTDLHIGLPHTIPDHPMRFHRIEISIPNFNHVVEQLMQLDIDFLLIPGDLTQNGEIENHTWISQTLAKLPFPIYVIPGNHDALSLETTDTSIGINAFPSYYRKHGYEEGSRPYYTCTPLPGLRLIGLNSIAFDNNGKQRYAGYLDTEQLDWLKQVLTASAKDSSEINSKTREEILVMVHHNVLEHTPKQAQSRLGQRYMLENSAALLEILAEFDVRLIFTGHLHIQDIAYNHSANLFDITTGSLVSYPHPYRICRYQRDDAGQRQLVIESHRITSAPGWPDLQAMSRAFVQEQSPRFIRRLLSDPPLNLSEAEIEPLIPHLRNFWTDIADGDAQFDFAHLPQSIRLFFEAFSAEKQWDNHAILDLH